MAGYKYLLEFFKKEGFRFEEKDSSIMFKIQGRNYLAFKNEDSSFLQIVSIYDVEGISRTKLLETCNSLNEDRFVLKYTINESSDAYGVHMNSSPTPLQQMMIICQSPICLRKESMISSRKSNNHKSKNPFLT